jgi:FkbM family methyltransferase
VKKYFFDCGSHHGDNVEHFARELSLTQDWYIFSFEPNKDCVPLVRQRFLRAANVNVVEAAVWTDDTSKDLNPEAVPGSAVCIGSRSSVLGLWDWTPGESESSPGSLFGAPDPVKCIDFGRFLQDVVAPGSTTIVHFNIEGAEYEVLRKMCRDGSIKMISELFVRFHHDSMKTENERSTEDLKRMLSACNPQLHVHVLN